MDDDTGWTTLRNTLAPIVVFVFLFGGLELAVRGLNISRKILPAPTTMVYALGQYFASDLWFHFLITMKVIAMGFFVGVPLGIIIAAVMSEFRILERTFSPYVILVVTTPLITLVPLFMLWLGFGSNVRALVVIIQTIPIVVLDSLTGFNAVPRERLELMDSLGSNRIQKFFRVTFPNALPQVFDAMKLGAIFATIAAVSTGFAGAKTGLGSRIVLYAGYIETALVYACILLVAGIGVTLYLLLVLIEGLVIDWRPE